MSRLRRAARSTLVIQGFSLIGLVLSFVTVPLYLAWLGNERYGMMLTALACAGYLMFSDAGLSWSSMLLIANAHGREDRADIARIVRHSVTLASVSSVLVVTFVFVVALLLRHGPAAWLPLPGTHPETFGLALAVGFQVLVGLNGSPIYNVFIGLQEAHLGAIYQGAGRTLGVGASLLAAAHGAPLGWVLAANSLCALLAAGAAGFHAWRRHRWAFARGPFWERDQIRRQYRTGTKSFGLQIGRVLVSSAPVFAISSGAGARFVSGFTIPLTLLNTPLGVFSSFNATLQAAYGEALARGDMPWVHDTVRSILRNLLLFQGLLAAGFLPLACPVIELWTHGRATASTPLLLSALVVGLLGATLGVFQFVLSGINRHRAAGASELLNGLLCLALGSLAVTWLGYGWVGAGILVAAGLTSAWVFPSQVKRQLDLPRLWPEPGFLLAVPLATAAAGLAGEACRRGVLTMAGTGPFGEWVSVLATGPMVVAVYLGLLFALRPADARRLWAQLTGLVRRRRGAPAVALTTPPAEVPGDA